MMRVGLILPGNIWFAPYVRIYSKVLDELGVGYDIISWNRDGSDKQEGIQFSRTVSSSNRRKKLIPYISYASFVRREVRKRKYGKLIVFGPQLGIFLSGFLRRRFKGRYLFDYRDLSIEQKRIFAGRFRSVVRNSYANFISSPGFEKVLPKGFDYHISHNFDVDMVRKALEDKDQSLPVTSSPKMILTIGGLRDYSANAELIRSLANNPDYTLRFVGKGPAAKPLEDYCKESGIRNVSFSGYYQKEEEPGIIAEATFLNIYYPRVITHDTALSNRFYNSLIHKKPLIVTKGTTQGDYAENYQVGVALENCIDVAGKLDRFLKEDRLEYERRCDGLLESFLADYDVFFKILKTFFS